MPTKTYVLLDTMDADAPVYVQTPNGREQVKKIPFHRPTLRQQYYDEDGNSKVIRYKSASKFTDQWKQIEEEKILANEPFTASEYKDCQFRHGIIVTNKVRAQEYLEAHPECLGFKGTCDDVREPKYKLVDKEAESKERNIDIRLRLQAGNKVIASSLEQLQSMLIRLNGSFFKTPDNKEDCENLLIEFIDDSEEPGLRAILKEDEDVTIDDKSTILIGKLINTGILSFDAIPNKVAKKDKNDKWIPLIDMSSDYDEEEKKRLFSLFLNTEGSLLKSDFENEISSEKTSKKKSIR